MNDWIDPARIAYDRVRTEFPDGGDEARDAFWRFLNEEKAKRENDITAMIERLALRVGFAATCRLMRRDGFEDQGEQFPPYDEYEIRAKGRVLNMDAEFVERIHDRGAVFDLIEANLKQVFK